MTPCRLQEVRLEVFVQGLRVSMGRLCSRRFSPACADARVRQEPSKMLPLFQAHRSPRFSQRQNYAAPCEYLHDRDGRREASEIHHGPRPIEYDTGDAGLRLLASLQLPRAPQLTLENNCYAFLKKPRIPR